MEYTLTLVARDPKYRGTDPFTDDDPAGGENDGAIADVMKRLRERKGKDKDANVVYRMSTLADIVKGCQNYTKQYKRTPDFLQLVGHGMAGSLAIGQAWLPPKAPIVANGEVYTLNSNPDLYTVIAEGIAPRVALRVLGCDAGKAVPSNGSIVDGPTFLFALTRVLDVPVEGPVCMIGFDDFDDYGNFNKPQWMMRAHNLAVTQPHEPKPAQRAAWLSR